jgi:hypothetical protein
MKKKVPVRGHNPKPLTLITTPTVWDLVVVDGGPVRIAGRDERPCVAIWSTRGKVLSVQPSLGAALPLSEGYAEARAVSGGAPAEVHVERAELVAAVQAVVGDAVKVSVGASVEAKALAQRLLDGLAPVANAAKVDTFLTFLRAPKELVDQFARQALALAALAPWKIVPSDGDALLVHTPGLSPSSSTVLITGQLGESYAVLVFDSFDDVRAFLAVAERMGNAPPSTPGAAFHAISFDEPDDLGPEIVTRMKRAGYPVPWKGRFPVPMFTERYDAPSPVSPGALLRLTVIADGLRQFFARRGREIEDDLYAHVSLTGETRVSGAPRAWTVEYPHPALGDDEGDDEGEIDVFELIAGWTHLFEARFPEDVHDARVEIVRAHVGRSVTPRDVNRDHLVTTSLPRHWASTSRVLADGKHPLSRAQTLRDLPAAFAPALSLLRQQRVILGEVVDVHEGVVVVQDLVDGTRYTVDNIPREQVLALRRWFYLFVQVVPVGGGRWGYLSLFTAQERFVESLWPTFEETLREELQALGRPAQGRDVHALLLREAGVAHAIFVRLGEAARARPKRRYLENSDGDRVEFITLTLQLPGTSKTVRAALDAMPELERVDPSTWGWIDRSRTTSIPAGESLAVIESRRRGCTVSVNSPTRADRAFALLRARFGDEVVEVKRTIESPWKQVPGIVAEKGDGVEVQVIANGPMPVNAGDEPGSPRGLFDRYVLRSLDEHVPMVGGVPREVAKTPEGRDRVERWLRDFETRGAPGEGGQTFFDADPLRRALGLTPITSR